MPLPNRVTPFGDLVSLAARGLMMGNRGGRLHDDRQRLGTRRWASKQWICCQLAFNNRHRQVWGDSYSELFFLDEVTAFAAGHRPCFECRRHAAEHFAALFVGGEAGSVHDRVRAATMDAKLHAERLDGKAKRRHRQNLDEMPDGVMVVNDGAAYAVRGRHVWRWSPDGYVERQPRPRAVEVDALTPPAIVAVLKRGYAPLWHPSADL
ncbi:MAG: hypothetical protein GC182_11295 [Rhodopseudomonas sp.]|nr:hypothetical protein [Rhodopseudomonas sp.]